MKEPEEQSLCIKFSFKLGKNFTETFQLLNQTYGDDCMSGTQCYEWFKRFKEGGMTAGEDPRPGRPSTTTNDNVYP
jgi:transposase